MKLLLLLMRPLGLCVLSLPLLLLGACASAPPAGAPPQRLLLDSAFKPPAEPVDPQAVLRLSPAMRDYLAQDIARLARRSGSPRQGLIEALYSRQDLQLDYDAQNTRNAAEAFAARRGNCLSLVLMTAAFARALDLPLQFNDVHVDELWRRSGQLYILSGHVNISLGARREPQTVRMLDADRLTIDFLPQEDLRRQRRRPLAEHTVIAMYLNNRAAETLEQGQTNEAYWWARAAVQQDPHLLIAYNTLGVIYRRQGLIAAAEQVFAQLLREEPGNLQAMANMVLALHDVGKLDEAEQLQARLRSLQPHPPYYFFDQGVAAMHGGDYAAAKQWFAREIARAAYTPEFHFWLALANLGLRDIEAVRRELQLAQEHSTTDADRSRYTAKLESLRRVRTLQ